jgi:hypothetical protein
MSAKWACCSHITQVSSLFLQKIEIYQDPRLVKRAAHVALNENLTQPYLIVSLASREKEFGTELCLGWNC